MDPAERKELLQYLKDAIQQESDILTQEKIITEYDESSERRKPIMPEREEIEAPNYASAKKFTSTGYFHFWWICWTIALFLFLFGGINASPNKTTIRLYNEDKHLWQDEYNEMLSTMQKGRTELIIGAFALGFGILSLFLYNNYKKQIEKENDQLRQNWNNRRDFANQKYDEARNKYYTSLREWQAGNTEMHTFLEEPLEKSKRVLSAFYQIDRIYPKYHNLPALTSIYEYLISGRCNELTGPHGAYNMYEDEVRKDTVISQMNTIIANLETIRNNQYMLYEQVKGIQRTANLIGQELVQIKGYAVEIAALTELTAYYTGLNAHISAISTSYQLLS